MRAIESCAQAFAMPIHKALFTLIFVW